MRMKWIGIFTLLTVVPVLQAQQVPLSLSDIQKLQGEKPVELSPEGKAPVLEHAVDPEEYVIGPGDVFQVLIGSRTDQAHRVRVDPEGQVFIPNVGSIVVNGKSLQEARNRIQDRITQEYRTARLSIRLVELRSFRVIVSGAVNTPGTVKVTAVSRVSEAISKAGGFINVSRPRIETPPSGNQQSSEVSETGNRVPEKIMGKEIHDVEPRIASRRRIQLIRRSGTTLNVDLSSYFWFGSLKTNPYLLDGDVIIVPVQDSDAGQVGIYGAVKAPRTVEFLPGDTVRDLFKMAHGLRSDADSSTIVLARFQGRTDELVRKRLPLGIPGTTDYDETMSVPLQANDRILVRGRSDVPVKRNVQVIGQVNYPGTYALDHEARTLTDVIEMAGGLTPQASLAMSYVLRRQWNDKIAEQEVQRLATMRPMEMMPTEREYFKFMSRERQGVMPIDFEALFKEGDERYDVPLISGDEIHIPTREASVKVFGQVVNPGIYPYRQGKTVEYYVDLAGGYNWNARTARTRLINTLHGEWSDADDDSPVNEGDQIFVPEEPEPPDRNRDWWDLTKDVIAIASQVATIYLILERTSDSNSN